MIKKVKAKKKFTLSEMGDMLAFLVKRVATREEVKEIVEEVVEEKLQPIREVQAEHTTTLSGHTATLADHTRTLNILRHDSETNLDKRLQMEVTVKNMQKDITSLKR